jgi:glycosyltransferase involved in cell wall biosynthesis
LDATPLLGQPTGVGVFCQGALAALGARSDLDVRAFAVSWRRRSGLDSQLPPGVTAHQQPMPARPLHALWRRGPVPPLEWFIGTVDVVHGTNFVVPPTRRAASVVSVHDLTPLHHPELCNEATLAYPELIRKAIGRGAWVHTDSSFVAAEVVGAFPVEPARVVAVCPGIPPLPDVNPDFSRDAIARTLPTGCDRYILAIGTAEPRKDLPGLVRAFDDLSSKLPDLALVLAGPPGWGEDSLDAAVRAARVPERIVRTGWTEPDRLSALLRGAAVLAYPSRYEGFGFPPLQAMAAGVPVVATTAGSLPEVLGDGALLVGVGDHEGLVDALERALTDDAVRDRLIAAGHARAATFSWDRCGEGLEGLYRAAAGASGG